MPPAVALGAELNTLSGRLDETRALRTGVPKTIRYLGRRFSRTWCKPAIRYRTARKHDQTGATHSVMLAWMMYMAPIAPPALSVRRPQRTEVGPRHHALKTHSSFEEMAEAGCVCRSEATMVSMTARVSLPWAATARWDSWCNASGSNIYHRSWTGPAQRGTETGSSGWRALIESSSP